MRSLGTLTSTKGGWDGTNRDQYNSHDFTTMYLSRRIDSFCLVSMMRDRAKRDLNERKWGSWAENKS